MIGQELSVIIFAFIIFNLHMALSDYKNKIKNKIKIIYNYKLCGQIQ